MINKPNSYDIGVNAESLVLDYYTGLGFILVSHRYKTPYGEIDLIMQNQDLVVFIEVKARAYQLEGAYVTAKQIRRSCMAANMFISSYHNAKGKCFRFDVITIVNGVIDQHIENAWQFDGY